MRRAAKVDANQDAIVSALRAAGASVQSLAPTKKQAAATRNLQLAAATNASREFGVWRCATCGSEARATVHQLRKTYCSKNCMTMGYTRRMAGSANPNHRDAGKRVCEACGGDYRNYNKDRRYCSWDCYTKLRIGPKERGEAAKRAATALKARAVQSPYVPKRKPRAEKPCLQCGKQFKFSPSQAKRRFCSYACHLASGGAFRAGIASARATMKYGAKKDANHKEIFAVLRKVCAVYDLSAIGCGLPDGLAWVGGKWQLFDVKNPKTAYGRRGLNAVQKKWLAQWQGGPVYLIHTVDEALQFGMGRLQGLRSVTPDEALAAIGAIALKVTS